MAIGGLTQGAAVGVYVGSWTVMIYTLAGGIIWNVLVRPLEEEHLHREFGAAYDDYQKELKCWIPTMRPIPASDHGSE